MGSILNFIKLPNTQFNGEGLVTSPPDNVPLFHISVFENWLVGTDFEISSEYKEGRKNIFYIECFEGLTNFYKKDAYTNKTILDTIPSDLLEKISQKDCKILLTSLSEGTQFEMDVILNIESELKRFNIKNENLIIIESNFKYSDANIKFKTFGSNHFFVHSASTFDSVRNNEISDLGYPISLPSILDAKTVTRQKHFLCFMRNTQKFHRHYLLLYLIHEGILDKTIISAIRKIDKQYSIDTQGDTLAYLTKYVDVANDMIPIEIDTHGFDNKMGFSPLNCYRMDEYLNSYIHIVTETTYEDKKLFFTEKISKPILGLQPFIVFSNIGYLKKLKEFGFKTFDSIIDESYDLEPDVVKRFLMTANEIKKLSELSLDELHKVYISVLDICIYNRNHLKKIYKEDMMLQNIKVIENEW